MSELLNKYAFIFKMIQFITRNFARKQNVGSHFILN